MPNPAGSNQFMQEPAYGEVKRLTQLQREAPMSGAPVAAQGTNAARRSQKRAIKGQPAPQLPGGPATPEAAPAAAPDTTAPSYEQELAAVWRDAADQQGASPTVRALADLAERAAGGAA